jgi:hypothetical protein
MLGQLCWLPALGSNGEKVLHLRTNPSQPWRHYTLFHSTPFQTTKFQKVLKGGQPTKNCYEQIGL